MTLRMTHETTRRRKIFCFALYVLTLALGLSAEAQQPKKVPRIGYLSTGDAASESTRAEAFRLALRERGYVEGQNIATEYRYADGKRIISENNCRGVIGTGRKTPICSVACGK